MRWWIRRDPGGSPPPILGVVLVTVLLTTAAGAAAGRAPNQPGAADTAGSGGPTTSGPSGPAGPDPAGGTPPADPASAPPAPLPADPRTTPQSHAMPPRASPSYWQGDPSGDFLGWALLTRGGGGNSWLAMSDNGHERSTTASMIKVWIAADYLRLADEAGVEPSAARLGQLTAVIRDSDNEYAQEIFTELGSHESINRMIEICGLPYAQAVPYRWSNTQLSPIDAVLMGSCIADGHAAGPRWTSWLLDEMRLVRGVGDFGIREAVPPEQRQSVAIKNGWVIRADQDAWHVNCLAISDEWVMSVMTRYPAARGYRYGADICREIAAEHLPQFVPAPVEPEPTEPGPTPQGYEGSGAH